VFFCSEFTPFQLGRFSGGGCWFGFALLHTVSFGGSVTSSPLLQFRFLAQIWFPLLRRFGVLFCLFVNVCLFVMFRARHRVVRRI
jgi:hypothetical protein